MQELSNNELELVDGGSLWSSVRHGAYEAYRTAVSYPTAAIGGYQLANQMYGANATWSDRFRAMSAMRGMLAQSDTLPQWSRFGY
jgi:hypothetical protein